ncbi:hypothetical protein [Pelomonas cellulosilytica]|uniref:Uncharacterized protein n=1 Tax=Pelomonas cellulosilytica TaxID=2906762 RepID=A0ABS8XUW0_9BURK|nr:hypothetical protein [Pelomonas sp. P8]MCE4555683.1 hypothetical protein [Pelomonas sp. P8]
MTLTWLLLILAVALAALGALRFDVLVARWRELMGQPPAGQAPPVTPAAQPTPQGTGAHAHAAPVHKPDFHRSGRRH